MTSRDMNIRISRARGIDVRPFWKFHYRYYGEPAWFLSKDARDAHYDEESHCGLGDNILRQMPTDAPDRYDGSWDHTCPAPDYTGSLDAAMKLVDEMEAGGWMWWEVSWHTDEKGYQFQGDADDPEIDDLFNCHGATPQEAIAAAWLEWKGE